jgi:hypothetical protein
MRTGTDELDQIGAAYLEHLSGADLRALVRADEATAREAEVRVAALRREPALVLDVLARPATSTTLLNLAADRTRGGFSFVSPFLVFVAAVHRTAADLAGTSYAPERAAPRLRVPVFDAAQLAEYLADPWHRLFLAELLASFARTSSGVIVTRTPRGLRRRRWNDLDLSRLAGLLEAVPHAQRPGVWRRLGDLALFHAGVFPDAVARTAPAPAEAIRLAQRTGLRTAPDAVRTGAELLEWFGAGWYGLAAQHSQGLTAATAHLRDTAEHIHQARRVLNTVTDRYLFPVTTDWFAAPG